jgi:hypothetical protein
MSTPPNIEHVYAVVAIGETCGHADCDQDAGFVFPLLTREDGGTLRWLCQEHAEDIRENVAADTANTAVYQVQATCGHGRGDPQTTGPCGAAATRLAVLGVRDPHPRLATASYCDKHAPRMEED